MSKKIGVISLYHNSNNYGGNLQAYALCRYLREEGFNAEQISYLLTSQAAPADPLCVRLKRMLVLRNLAKSIVFRIKNLITHLMNQVFQDRIAQRYSAIHVFNQWMIPHSQQVYTEQTVAACNSYDAYITGSDQVWNPLWYHAAFFLDFVPKGKKKISYAASLGVTELTEEQTQRFQEKLDGFTAISVRERDAVGLLEGLVPVPVVQTLDPTMLLTREQWDEICSPRLIPEKYIFTYFLGEDKNQRKVASAFSKEKGVPIVTLPHLLGTARKCDVFFGDKKLYSVSPADFISLIKHADYVLTDSFHACVFSSLYHKEFFVFQRLGRKGMSGRLYSLTALFGCEDHFCDTEERATLNYLQALPRIDYSKPCPEFERMKAVSIEFLQAQLTNE